MLKKGRLKFVGFIKYLSMQFEKKNPYLEEEVKDKARKSFPEYFYK